MRTSNYVMPGITMGRREARISGALIVTVGIVAAFAVHGYDSRPQSDRIHIRLRTEQIGEGIIEGTQVSLDGADIGTVQQITSIPDGRQLLTLNLDRSQLNGVGTDLNVAYAPSNLFGISTVVLEQIGHGQPLQDGTTVDFTGKNAARVTDVTLSRLIRMLTGTSVKVLTPQLTKLITQFSGDLRQFTPFLQSLVVLSRTVVDTQRFPPSYLLTQFSAFLGGLGDFASSSLKLLESIVNTDILEHDRSRFDATIHMLGDDALPGMAQLGLVSQPYFSGYTSMFTPVMQALADTVPTPAVSRAHLSELLNRLDHVFTSTPTGPTANVEVLLHGMPDLSVPLLGGPAGPQGGHR